MYYILYIYVLYIYMNYIYIYVLYIYMYIYIYTYIHTYYARNYPTDKLSQKKEGLIYSSIVRSVVQNSRHRRSYF